MATDVQTIAERSAENGWRAFSKDEFGEICSARGVDKADAVNRCKRRTKARLDGELVFSVTTLDYKLGDN